LAVECHSCTTGIFVHIFGGNFLFSISDFLFSTGNRSSFVHQCSMLFSKWYCQLGGELEIGIIPNVFRDLAGSPPRSRRGNGRLSTGRPRFWPCTCRGSAEGTGAVSGDSEGCAGGDRGFVTAGVAARDSVGGARGDPVVVAAGEAAGDSVGVGGPRRWRSGGSRGGGGGE